MKELNGSLELEQQIATLQQRIAALERQQSLLLYTLSHDLRTPIMTVLGFTDLLLADLQDSELRTHKQYLERIRISTKRQIDLVEALLKVIRLQEQPLQLEISDLSALAQACMQELLLNDMRQAPQIQIEVTPKVTCDPQLMRTALRELLSNALKFTRDIPNPNITFGATQQLSREVFFVRDNGIGLDASRSPRLFQSSQRLHAQQGYEGAGMGLVIAAAIIRKHGGKIWIESESGKGATVYFTMAPQSE